MGEERQTLLYRVSGQVATITLNRPDELNTIVPPMPEEVEAAVSEATRDPAVKVIVLRGAGRAFCAGYDFGEGFRHWGATPSRPTGSGTRARTSPSPPHPSWLPPSSS